MNDSDNPSADHTTGLRSLMVADMDVDWDTAEVPILSLISRHTSRTTCTYMPFSSVWIGFR